MVGHTPFGRELSSAPRDIGLRLHVPLIVNISNGGNIRHAIVC